jgi:gamma-glutamylcyclotransferase (GGCT)/AIG2-like uncharacterized protein YtfP
MVADQLFLGEARTRPLYALFDLGTYPGLVQRKESGRAIHGEIYEVAESLIEKLDRIEGAPSLFHLEPIQIENHPGEVFTYFYQQETEGHALCAEDRWMNKGCTS